MQLLITAGNYSSFYLAAVPSIYTAFLSHEWASMTKKNKKKTRVVMTISFPSTDADLPVGEAELVGSVLLFGQALIETCLFIAPSALSRSC